MNLTENLNLNAAFINGEPLWHVPGLFSWQHVVIMAVAAAYITGLTLLLKGRRTKTRSIVFKVLSASCLLVFCGRFLWGYDSLIYTPMDKRVGYWYQTLVPLELCNLGIFILMLAAFTKKRFWYMLSFYITLTGGITAFFCFPNSHQWPRSDILNFQFFDYYYIHAHLVALPVAFVATGAYRPRMTDIWKALLSVMIIAVSLLLYCIIMNAVYNTNTVNYLWVMGDYTIPLIKDLWALIGIPLVYLMPVIPAVFVLLLIVSLLFTPKGRRLNDFLAMFGIKRKTKD